MRLGERGRLLQRTASTAALPRGPSNQRGIMFHFLPPTGCRRACLSTIHAPHSSWLRFCTAPARFMDVVFSSLLLNVLARM